MDRVSDLPHTADIGFEVEASSLERLFELAAEGLVRALDAGPMPDAAGPDASPAGDFGSSEASADRERVTLTRPDLDRLLVAWLRELLHRATADHLLPVDVRTSVDRDRERGASLGAEVAWREWTEDTAPAREIKGVTYHGLKVEERDGAWHAKVFLDV